MLNGPDKTRPIRFGSGRIPADRVHFAIPNTSHNGTTIANTEAKRSQHLIKAKPITDSNLANNQSKQNQH